MPRTVPSPTLLGEMAGTNFSELWSLKLTRDMRLSNYCWIGTLGCLDSSFYTGAGSKLSRASGPESSWPADASTYFKGLAETDCLPSKLESISPSPAGDSDTFERLLGFRPVPKLKSAAALAFSGLCCFSMIA